MHGSRDPEGAGGAAVGESPVCSFPLLAPSSTRLTSDIIPRRNRSTTVKHAAFTKGALRFPWQHAQRLRSCCEVQREAEALSSSAVSLPSANYLETSVHAVKDDVAAQPDAPACINAAYAFVLPQLLPRSPSNGETKRTTSS